MATELPYDGNASRSVAGVFGQQERISKLERGLTRLETIVEQLVVGMDKDRDALKELGRKMEQSVASLAEEMKKLAERSSNIDNTVLAKQSQALGAIAATRWIIGTAIAFGALIIAYQAGEAGRHIDAEKSHVTQLR